MGELVIVNTRTEQSGVYRVQATHNSVKGEVRRDSQEYYLNVIRELFLTFYVFWDFLRFVKRFCLTDFYSNVRLV